MLFFSDLDAGLSILFILCMEATLVFSYLSIQHSALCSSFPLSALEVSCTR